MWIVTGKKAGMSMMDVINMDNILDVYTIDRSIMAMSRLADDDGTITLGRYRTDEDAECALGLLFARMQDAEEHRGKGRVIYATMPTVQAAEDAREKIDEQRKGEQKSCVGEH